MEFEFTFMCPVCLQENHQSDWIASPSGTTLGFDCEICCNPLRVTVVIDPDTEEAFATAEAE